MNRTCLRLASAATLGLLAACNSTKQKVSFGDAVNTPPHHMSHADYPFDDGGHYVDAWAAENEARYPHGTDSDSHRSSRSDRSTSKKPQPKKGKDVKPTPKSGKSGTKPPARSSSKITIKVKHGDTVGSLSRKYDVSSASIRKANGLSSDKLREGRTLTIPK